MLRLQGFWDGFATANGHVVRAQARRTAALVLLGILMRQPPPVSKAVSLRMRRAMLAKQLSVTSISLDIPCTGLYWHKIIHEMRLSGLKVPRQPSKI